MLIPVPRYRTGNLLVLVYGCGHWFQVAGYVPRLGESVWGVAAVAFCPFCLPVGDPVERQLLIPPSGLRTP